MSASGASLLVLLPVGALLFPVGDRSPVVPPSQTDRAVKPSRADGTARFPCGRVGRCRNVSPGRPVARSHAPRGVAFSLWQSLPNQLCASDQPPSTPSTPERKRSLSHLSFGDRRVPPRPSEQVRAAARPDDHNPLTDCASPSNSFRNELKMDTPLTRMRPPKTRVRDPRSPGRARTTGRKLNRKVSV